MLSAVKDLYRRQEGHWPGWRSAKTRRVTGPSSATKDKLTRLDDMVEEYLACGEADQGPIIHISRGRAYLTGKYFKPLHSMLVDGISRRDIAARLVIISRESGEGSTATCARTYDHQSPFFTWAMGRWGWSRQ